MAPNSPNAKPAIRDTSPPAIHARKNHNGDGRAEATSDGVRKMALATTPPTMSSTASKNDMPRIRPGDFALADAVSSAVVWVSIRLVPSAAALAYNRTVRWRLLNMKEPVNSNRANLMHPDVGYAHTLPSSYYLNPEVLEQEKRSVFWRTWQVVGYREQVAKPGDYFTYDLIGEPLLIVRDTENKLRGYYNVCRHRAGPPAEGCGSKKVFRCLYHGWTYGLDGRLLNAPEMEGVSDFRKEEFSLRAVNVAEWAGLVFVN